MAGLCYDRHHVEIVKGHADWRGAALSPMAFQQSEEKTMRFNSIPGVRLLVGVCAVVLGAVSPDVASAACLQEVAGAYLTTITSGPTVTSRSTILLHVHGTMSVVDSGQGTVGFTA